MSSDDIHEIFRRYQERGGENVGSQINLFAQEAMGLVIHNCVALQDKHDAGDLDDREFFDAVTELTQTQIISTALLSVAMEMKRIADQFENPLGHIPTTEDNE